MTTEHFDVLIIGAGLSGIGAGVPPAEALPGPQLRDPRGARQHRRHLGPVPLSRRALRFGHVHARLFVQALGTGEGDRRRAFDPEVREGHGAGITASTARSATTTRSSARPGRRRTRAGRSKPSAAARRSRCASPATSFSSAAATTSTRKATRPSFPAPQRFRGRIVHPQKWTSDIDYAGKRVVVIGSGATAVTLVPEMAKTAAHVTMLQRSPTYVVARPAEDGMANWLRRHLPGDVRLRHLALEARAAAACISSTCAGASPSTRRSSS